MIKYSLKKILLIGLLLSLVFSQSIFVVDAYEINNDKLHDKINTTANGIVVDIETGSPVSNAIITYSEINSDNPIKINTDVDGKFYIDSIKTGYYNWKVEVDNYNIALFNGYPIISGGNNYFFEISRSSKIELNYNRQTETLIHADENLNNNLKSMINENYEPNGVPQDPPTIPMNVKVKRSSGSVVSVPLEDYIAHVISREMDPNYYIYDGMTNAQKNTMLEVQAITARSYAAFHFYKKDRHPGQSYQFCDMTHCQVYDPTYCPQLCIDATNNTAKKIMIKVVDVQYWIWEYIDAVFSASCKGNTKNNETVWGGSPISYLRSVSCPYDIRPTLTLGHNVGLCQDGVAGYAKNGYLTNTILSHYFTGVRIIVGDYYNYN